MKRHIKNVHEGIKPFKCNLCDHETARNSNLMKHIENVHEGKNNQITEKINKNKFECSVCGMFLATQKILRQHIKSIHEGIKPYQCSMCDAKYAVKSYLNEHMISVHESIRPYNCAFCESKFKVQKILNAHIRQVHKIENLKNSERINTQTLDKTEKITSSKGDDYIEYQLPFGWKKVGHRRINPG